MSYETVRAAGSTTGRLNPRPVTGTDQDMRGIGKGDGVHKSGPRACSRARANAKKWGRWRVTLPLSDLRNFVASARAFSELITD